ncbi:response regulator [Longitalea luteola]|uniref:response regulator n=1 Tax=Longitalea luteola TaxID=2812563 RepID=UPI001A97B395|nr:response regulator [Longitalea luteola]
MTVFKRIMLAEDDEDDKWIFTEIMKKLTANRNIHFDVVDNGVQILHALENTPKLPDLVILDQNMPQLNGKETLKLIKKNDRFNHIPVVIYSTYNDSRLSNECFDIGATQIITKPDTFEGFREMIEMLVQKYCNS